MVMYRAITQSVQCGFHGHFERGQGVPHTKGMEKVGQS